MVGEALAVGLFNNIYGAHREREARKENYYYNEMAAQNADIRTRALYNDLYSPQAQLQQLKAAGLSPSLFYGDGGGIAGQTGAQGAGASGLGPTVFGLDPMALAQTQLIEAQTRKTNAEADQVKPLAQATITQLLADAGLKEAETCYKEAVTAITNIDKYIKEQTTEKTIRKINWECDKAEWNAESAMWDAFSKELDYNFNVETYKKRVEEVTERVNNLMADTFLKNAQKEYTDEEKKAIAVKINQRWKELAIEAEKVGTMKTGIQNQKDYWDKCINNFKDALKQDMQQFDKSLKQGYIRMGVDAVAKIGAAALGGGMIKGLFSGATQAAGTGTYVPESSFWE